jgi:hypothetical protein
MLAFTAEGTIKKFFRIVAGGASIVAHNSLSKHRMAITLPISEQSFK